MRRALLACSLLGAAFAAIQQPSDAQTVYKGAQWTDTETIPGTQRTIFSLDALDIETGTARSESNAPLKILESEYDGIKLNSYRNIYRHGLYSDGYAYYQGVEYGDSGAYNAVYKVDLSDFSYEIIPGQAFDWNTTSSKPFIVPANGDAGGGGSAVDLTPVHQRIDANKTSIASNKSAIHKNKKAIDTNRTNINNLGDGIAASTALGAALSALPVTPDDAPFSCGVGSGAYSSRFAMGLGCVAKLNQRLSINAGGSHVFGGSSNYGGGSLDSVAWRGGFVLKLGKLDSPVATNEQLQSKVKELEERNAAVDAKYSAIQEENAAMKAKYSTIEEQNAVITQQNKALMARLERLEAIALGQQPAATTASLK